MNFKYLIIDLDLPVFKCAAAAEKTIYHLKDSEGAHIETFQSAKECKSYIQDAEEFLGIDTSGWERTSEVIIKDFQGCVDALDAMIKNYLKITKTEIAKCSIGGKGNFRDDLAKIHKYKGQRKTEKPHHFKALREYAIKTYKPVVSSGVESDDLISIWLYKDFLNAVKSKNKSSCIHLMLDAEKDCRTSPGWHFDPKLDEEPVWISRLEANRWTYTQALAGDSADNYKGCKGIGMVKAKTALKDCVTSTELYEVALQLYKDVYGESHTFTTWEGEEVTWKTEQLLEENLRLAHMLRCGDKNQWKKHLGVPEL